MPDFYRRRIITGSGTAKTILITLLLLTTGCSSSFAIRTAYNSSMNSFAREMISYASFQADQQSTIKRRAASFKQWHKSVQLPVYNDTLEQIKTSLSATESVSKVDVQSWITTMRKLSLQFAHCNPLNGSGEFLSELSDRQVSQIAAGARKKQQKKIRDYQSRSAQQRLKRRHDDFVKWARRGGITITESQSALVKEALKNQISLSPQRHLLWQRWSDQFFQLLEKRSTPEFVTNVNLHINTLWNITEKTYPEQWTSNINHWTDFLHQFLQSLTDDQATQLVNLLNKVSKALTTLSEEKPKAQPRCFAVNAN